ncbi:MAG TPA: HNH endonuclease [Acholeplasmataceae bacterium]|nr:HNH endonuclease [Acholeplasmataceae bacterium]
MKKPKVLHNFYKSPAWLAARELKIMSVDGLCERCGAIGIEVHHKDRLSIDNVRDTSVSLNQDNLELLCRECHNQEHERFSNKIRFDKDGNLINQEKPK